MATQSEVNVLREGKKNELWSDKDVCCGVVMRVERGGECDSAIIYGVINDAIAGGDVRDDVKKGNEDRSCGVFFICFFFVKIDQVGKCFIATIRIGFAVY